MTPAEYVQFILAAATRCRQQAANLNPCADAGDMMKKALLERANEWTQCAYEMQRLQNRVHDLEQIETDRVARAT